MYIDGNQKWLLHDSSYNVANISSTVKNNRHIFPNN